MPIDGVIFRMSPSFLTLQGAGKLTAEGVLIMRIAFSILLLSLALSVHAEDWADVASSPGTGRLEVVSSFVLFSSSKSYEVVIPKRVESGTLIRVKYKTDSGWMEKDFPVAAISTKGDLCRLHSKVPSQYDRSASDTIYVHACRYR